MLDIDLLSAPLEGFTWSVMHLVSLVIMGQMPEMPSWTTLIGSAANIAFAVIVAWYLLTKALPKTQDTFTVALENLRKDFLAEQKSVRDYYDRREELSHSEHKNALHEVIQHCAEESRRREDVLKVELTLVIKAIEDQRFVLEEVRQALTKHNHS